MEDELRDFDGGRDLDGSGLKCPVCEASNLHHIGVTFYDRGEDADITTVREVLCKTAYQDAYRDEVDIRREPSDTAKNPSRRRSGMEIHFACENCQGTAVALRINQHKGTTYLDWKFGALKP